MELTILMPCLNEAETLEICIRKASSFLEKNNIDGEVLISDNGSTDGSPDIAKACGARVVHAAKKGYGSALITGCEEAYGKYVIMGDADDSYDFVNLMPFVEKLREGYDLVMGNRFKGGIEKGAMPWSHRYIGNPVLSFIGRWFFKSKIGDFHCGLRGYNRESILKLGLHTTGMEYASEMVVMAELSHLKIAEVPTTLKKDGRSHPPHLRSFRDGWRHLKFLFMYSPKWLFLFPGIVLILIGILVGVPLIIGDMQIGSVTFSIHTLLYCMMALIVGITMVYFYIFTKLYAARSSFLPLDKATDRLDSIVEDRGMLIGVILFLIGLGSSIYAFVFWKNSGYGDMNPELLMRFILPATTLIEIGIETIFASFFIGILKIDVSDKK
ncbi:MAG: glycosyltransferase family 2 protein [Lachnospiraceae bacterium]|nr:glycosyltransferase family 2 protein [Lachnospiraceae bacterium]